MVRGRGREGERGGERGRKRERQVERERGRDAFEVGTRVQH